MSFTDELVGMRKIQIDIIRQVFNDYIDDLEFKSPEDTDQLYIAALELGSLMGHEAAGNISWGEVKHFLNESPFYAEEFLVRLLSKLSPDVFINHRKPVIH